MLAESIVICRKKGIEIIADGFEKRQKYYPEQTPDYMEVADSFAREFGISYEHPIYDLSKKKIKGMIESAGIKGKPAQASCLFAFNRMVNENISEYTRIKLPIARTYIRNNLE